MTLFSSHQQILENLFKFLNNPLNYREPLLYKIVNFLNYQHLSQKIFILKVLFLYNLSDDIIINYSII